VITDEIVAAVARFFADGRGPSHDELGRAFRRVGLDAADPAVDAVPGEPIGKVKRVRQVLSHAIDHDTAAGDRLVKFLLGSIKASGAFRPDSESYAGLETIQAARDAFRVQGFDLDPEGNLRQLAVESLEGAEANAVLNAYVRRANLGSEDAAQVVGTGKDLLEAAARHALVETSGWYSTTADFPTTLHQAFDRLGLQPAHPLLKSLDTDPHKAFEQALYVLGNAVNRLRNAEGTGHGRPSAPTLEPDEARLSIRAMALVSEVLLLGVKKRRTRPDANGSRPSAAARAQVQREH
jgi:hypothetical protein